MVQGNQAGNGKSVTLNEGARSHGGKRRPSSVSLLRICRGWRVEGEEEEVEMAGDVLVSPVVSTAGPGTPSSLLAVAACSRCPGRSITSCPWGCSTVVLVSETPAAHQEQEA